MEENLPADEAALWELFKSQGNLDAREKLIQRYLPTTQTIAATIYANRTDTSCEFEDYLQFARVGLLEAVERFDPAREAAFETYATYRIRGSVLNGVEKLTELSTQKAQRRRLRRERLKSIRERAASDDPFVRMVDLTLNLAIGYLLEESGVWKPGKADRTSDPYESFELKRLCESMLLLMSVLPERERDLVRYHYFEHKEFTEIAAILNVSKGRVSQLHARALKLLQMGFNELDTFDIKA